MSDQIGKLQIWTPSKNTWAIIMTIPKSNLEFFSQVLQEIFPAGRKEECEGQSLR